MIQGKVEICGVNTSKLPLLKSEEKEALFTQIEAGDKNARKQYIEGNLRLVLSVIKRFSSSNENVDDLFQIGCIGLIKAIDNFDSTLNVKFSTYAVPVSIPCRKSLKKINLQLYIQINSHLPTCNCNLSDHSSHYCLLFMNCHSRPAAFQIVKHLIDSFFVSCQSICCTFNLCLLF